MTEKEFRNLFDSIRCSEAFTAHMEELLAAPQTGAFAETASGVSIAQKRGRWMGIAGLAACLLLVTGGTFFFFGQDDLPVQPPVSSEADTQPTTDSTGQTQNTAASDHVSLLTETVTVTETVIAPAAETSTAATGSAQTPAMQTTTIMTTSPLTETVETTTTAPELTGWQAAYLEIAEQFAEESEEARFSLVYFDEDDVPELAVSPFQTMLCMYTYHEGEAIELIDGWSFGAMGNVGYLYIPRLNSLQNYNHDYAGLLGYTTYMSITPEKTLEVTDVIETWNFNDLNGNGIPDEGEYDNELSYTVYYVNGVEITAEEAAAYSKGEYQPLGGDLTLEEFRAELEREW